MEVGITLHECKINRPRPHMALLMCVHLKQLCLARVQMERAEGWAGLTYLNLDEVGLAKGDEL